MARWSTADERLRVVLGLIFHRLDADDDDVWIADNEDVTQLFPGVFALGITVAPEREERAAGSPAARTLLSRSQAVCSRNALSYF